MIRKMSSFLLLILFLFIPLCAEVDLGLDSDFDPIDIVEQECIVIQQDCDVFTMVNDRTVIDIFSESNELISMNISSVDLFDLLTNAFIYSVQFSEKMIEDNPVNYSKGYNHFHPLLL